MDQLAAAINSYQLNDYADAERRAGGIVASDPDNFRALNLLGMSLYQQGRLEEGITQLQAAIRANPDYAAGQSNLATLYKEKQQYELALRHIELAIRCAPDDADFHQNRGAILFRMGRYDEAVTAYERAIALDPACAGAYGGLGAALAESGRLEGAMAFHDRAIALNPDDAAAYNNRGVALRALRRYDEALADFAQAIRLDPQYAEAYMNRAVAFKELNRHEEAMADFERALELKPDDADAYNGIGNLLVAARDYAGARAAYARCLAIDENYPLARGNMLKCTLHLCDWSNLGDLIAAVERGVDAGANTVDPFTYLAVCADPARSQRCARIWAGRAGQPGPAPVPAGLRPRLRVAYLSADFHQHATAYLMAELFERHDRGRFEITAVSFGPDDGSPMRARLKRAFDHFLDVSRLSDRQVAELLRERHIDIAVDLKGHTENSRPGILALRPAPIQVNYLGYPGTMGTPAIDYIIADSTLIPEGQQRYYDEKIVYLPDTYQPNDGHRVIDAATPTRQHCGLPDDGFVFCCFNNNYKILPGVFDVWMRLLREVEGSVLWLLKDSEVCAENLRCEAERRGIDGARLVFAPRTTLSAHLARHRLADLFLDTQPYNAHTTASDALWAGLPVLTCLGESFPGRVAASLVAAIGLPELVAANMAQYEALALQLAREPQALAEIRRRLAANRQTHPLFDCQRYARYLEQAYGMMWERALRGEPPETLHVPPAPEGWRPSRADP